MSSQAFSLRPFNMGGVGMWGCGVTDTKFMQAASRKPSAAARQTLCLPFPLRASLDLQVASGSTAFISPLIRSGKQSGVGLPILYYDESG
jgi:hypothetical protein